MFAVSSRINSTWGGNLVDMVRSRRILEVIETDGLMEHAAEAGRYLHARLEELAAEFPELVRDVRGRGLMRAFSLPSGAQRDELIGKLWDRRVVMLASGADSVRFRPALTVSYSEIDDAVAAVRDALTLTSVGAVSRRIDRPQSWQLRSADELAAVQLREFACGGREFVVGDDHGLRAAVHRRTRDDLLDGACARPAATAVCIAPQGDRADFRRSGRRPSRR